MVTLNLHCSECEASVSVPYLGNAPVRAMLIRKAASQGWGVVNNGDHNLCPSCIARAEPETENARNHYPRTPRPI